MSESQSRRWQMLVSTQNYYYFYAMLCYDLQA
jgi:hypothetical protein